MPASTDRLTLDLRTGLPDALKVLLEEFPREVWQDHPGFEGLIQFWLDRHMMFRRILEKMTADAMAYTDARIEHRIFATGVSRLGSMFVQQLHAHHNIEDVHYFPVLAEKERRIAAGFDLLDKDHHAIDGHLNRFVERANGVLQPSTDPARGLADFIADLQGLDRMLDRHLLDEEDLVVPVILKYGTEGLG